MMCVLKENMMIKLNSIDVEFLSTGVFLPYVMYITPILDKKLHEMTSIIHEEVIGEQSIEMLVDNVKQHFKDTDVNEIKKILK